MRRRKSRCRFREYLMLILLPKFCAQKFRRFAPKTTENGALTERLSDRSRTDSIILSISQSTVYTPNCYWCVVSVRLRLGDVTAQWAQFQQPTWFARSHFLLRLHQSADPNTASRQHLVLAEVRWRRKVVKTRFNSIVSYKFLWIGHEEHANLCSLMLTIACCLVVWLGLGLGLDVVSGWLVVHVLLSNLIVSYPDISSRGVDTRFLGIYLQTWV